MVPSARHMPPRILAGIFLFAGSAIFLLGMTAAEALTPRYTVTKAISDLGVGAAAPIFNFSLIVFGILVLTGSCLLLRAGTDRVFCALLVLSGAGAVGTGLFVETLGAIHIISAFIVFFFGGIAALYSVRVFRMPWAGFCLVLGAVTLVALLLLALSVFPGLGFGGMERMAACPLILWALGSGGFLMAGALKE